MARARDAYVSELKVSSTSERAGETLTTMSIFALPPRLSLSNCVNLWLRYGTITSF